MKKTRKPGSGRKKGSYSFCNVSLDAMNDLFGPKMNIKVSRTWAVEVGLVESDVQGVPETTKHQVNVKVQSLEDEDKTTVEVKDTEW